MIDILGSPPAGAPSRLGSVHLVEIPTTISRFPLIQEAFGNGEGPSQASFLRQQR
jgi:hypothetical protein